MCSSNMPPVYICGVGMTPFLKPGKHEFDYPDFASLAAGRALRDASITYDEVDQVVCGYVYGDSTAGQRAIYSLGLTGVPVVNVNNNCSTGSTALYLGRQAILSGQAECVLVVGFERMQTGSLQSAFMDRANPLDQHMLAMMESYSFGSPGGKTPPGAPWLFGNAGREHMERYGTTREHLAKVAVKNSKHSVNNPYSQFRNVKTLDQVLSSPVVYDPLTKLQCCPTSDGAAAAVLVSDGFLKKRSSLLNQCVTIEAQSLVTDFGSSFSKSAMSTVGSDMTKAAMKNVLNATGLSPKAYQVCELHDCFTANEVITYEALGLCSEGTAGKAIDEDWFTYGGRGKEAGFRLHVTRMDSYSGPVVNPSGGLLSKGHPLGATGLAQCAELTWQLRGTAGPRQVPRCERALQHNLGLGGACVVSSFVKTSSAKDNTSLSSDPSVLLSWETTGAAFCSRPTSATSKL